VLNTCWFVEWILVLACGVGGGCGPHIATDGDGRVGVVLCGLRCCAVTNLTVTECMFFVSCGPMVQSPFKCMGLSSSLVSQAFPHVAAVVVFCL
jgi:hypothetical protein